MNLPFDSKKNILYCLIIFTAILLGAVVYFKQLVLLFDRKDGGSALSSETFDIDEVRVKKLNTDIFSSKQFQELKEPDDNTVDIKSLDKGKKNPFLP